ncbi:hypothetical protein TSUD_322860 [Trifolium subterraneum]|uniref:Uncharacterized protein n=1 Tax=Trifolium subterraneum TaxID=3900 RepID=A0A2Z6M1K6_TRISU|nr:hypothetical protein TSUD_322860 [Trifolium subterraneum]
MMSYTYAILRKKLENIIIPTNAAAKQYSNLELEDFLPSNSPELGDGADASASKGASEELIGVGKNEEISGEVS